MGGAVSSGRDNSELIDKLVDAKCIQSREVERVFRALDRGYYMTSYHHEAYEDISWQDGPLHMSAPCIYSNVMENLELKPGLTFLNIGSGTGYLNTLVGLIVGSSGINHGVEKDDFVVEYSKSKLRGFLESSPTLDEFDFAEPNFICGNGLCLAPLQAPYDRVYCGEGCPEQYQDYFQQLIKVGGILIMPLKDKLLQVKRTGQTEWVTRSLLNVSFKNLSLPSKEESAELIRLDEQSPVRLQALCRAVVRSCVRGTVKRRHPEVCEAPPPAKRAYMPPRRKERGTGSRVLDGLLSFKKSADNNRIPTPFEIKTVFTLMSAAYGRLGRDSDDANDDDQYSSENGEEESTNSETDDSCNSSDDDDDLSGDNNEYSSENGEEESTNTEIDDSCDQQSSSGSPSGNPSRGPGEPTEDAPRVDRGAERASLSSLMEKGIKELPLPYDLQLYVNLGRSFRI